MINIQTPKIIYDLLSHEPRLWAMKLRRNHRITYRLIELRDFTIDAIRKTND
jgi:hypothetical protein